MSGYAFISIPLKESYEADLRNSLLISAEEQYDTDMTRRSDFRIAIENFNQLRSSVCCQSLEPNSKSLELLTRYLDQLMCMENRLSICHIHNPAELKWKSAIVKTGGFIDNIIKPKKVVVATRDEQYEKASVKFNVAAMMSQICTQLKLDNDAEEIINFMELSAGLFHDLNKAVNRLTVQVSPDLSSDVLTTFYTIMMAQAQEAVLHSQLRDNENKEVLLTSCSMTADLYTQASDKLQQNNVKEHFQEATIDTIKGKKLSYYALTLETQAEIEKEKSPLISYTRLEEAARIAQLAKKLIPNPTGSALLKHLSAIKPNFKAMALRTPNIEKAAKFNELRPLSLDHSGRKRAQHKDPVYPMTRMFQDLFSMLPEKAIAENPLEETDEQETENLPIENSFEVSFVPKTTYDCVPEKVVKPEEIIQSVVNVVNKHTIADDEIRKLREALSIVRRTLDGVPSEKQSENEMNHVRPQLEKIQDQGGVAHLHEVVKSSLAKHREVSSIIDETTSMIEDEETQDAKYRAQYPNRWTLQESSLLNEPFKKKLSTLKTNYRSEDRELIDIVTVLESTDWSALNLLMRKESDNSTSSLVDERAELVNRFEELEFEKDNIEKEIHEKVNETEEQYVVVNKISEIFADTSDRVKGFVEDSNELIGDIENYNELANRRNKKQSSARGKLIEAERTIYMFEQNQRKVRQLEEKWDIAMSNVLLEKTSAEEFLSDRQQQKEAVLSTIPRDFSVRPIRSVDTDSDEDSE